MRRPNTNMASLSWAELARRGYQLGHRVQTKLNGPVVRISAIDRKSGTVATVSETDWMRCRLDRQSRPVPWTKVVVLIGGAA